TLGVRQVVVKNANGTTTTTNFPIATAPTTVPLSAGCAPPSCSATGGTPPAVGSTAATGDFAAVDGYNRPMYPVVFITDLTTNGADACSPTGQGKCGDWQYGGTPQLPSFISGMWKGAVKTIDKTKVPAVVTIVPDADPSKNTALGPGADPIPSGVTNL